MQVVKGANLGLRFLLELGALAAVGWWGWDAGGFLLSLAAVAGVAAVWGLFVAPKRKLETPPPVRLAIEFAVWAAAGAALHGAGQTTLAVVFVAVAVISGSLNYAWK